MTDNFPEDEFDFSLVALGVVVRSDPALLVQKLGNGDAQGSISIFARISGTTRLAVLPTYPEQEKFREHVIVTWRESGGEPDSAPGLPALSANGLSFARRALIFCVHRERITCGNGLPHHRHLSSAF